MSSRLYGSALILSGLASIFDEFHPTSRPSRIPAPGGNDMVGQRGFQSLVGALALVGLSDPVAGQAPRPGIVVTVVNDAGLAADTLSRAKAHVARIYGDMGVDLMWADPTRTEASGRFLAHLIIRPTPPRPRTMGRALGDSRDAGGTAFVYRDRVVDVARARNLEVARVLAYTMAHEIGHLLLPYPSHAATGIMHGDWDGADCERMRTGSLHFTPAQASAIRAMWGGYGQERLAAQNAEAPLPRQEASSAGANQNRTERPTLLIHVDDQTHLGARDRDTAEKEVVRIYAAAGVNTIWKDGLPPAEETRADTFPRVTVAILNAWAPDMTAGEPRGSTMIGRAARAAGRAYIFYPRLEYAARLRDRHVGMVLGVAIAHEVGHLLLSKNGHSNIGIMRQDLNLKSHLPLDALGFTPAQSADIKKTLRMWPHRAK